MSRDAQVDGRRGEREINLRFTGRRRERREGINSHQHKKFNPRLTPTSTHGGEKHIIQSKTQSNINPRGREKHIIQSKTHSNINPGEREAYNSIEDSLQHQPRELRVAHVKWVSSEWYQVRWSELSSGWYT